MSKVGKKQGLLPTLLVLLVVAGTLTIIGIVIWMRMAPMSVPTQPPQPKPTSSLRLPGQQLANQGIGRSSFLIAS
jgi:hypothetical protein